MHKTLASKAGVNTRQKKKKRKRSDSCFLEKSSILVFVHVFIFLSKIYMLPSAIGCARPDYLLREYMAVKNSCLRAGRVCLCDPRAVGRMGKRAPCHREMRSAVPRLAWGVGANPVTSSSRPPLALSWQQERDTLASAQLAVVAFGSKFLYS